MVNGGSTTTIADPGAEREHVEMSVRRYLVLIARQSLLGRLLAGVAMAVLAILPVDTALAMTVEETIERFERCGYQVGDRATIYSVDGTPTTFFCVWTEDQRGVRSLVVYVYADADAADDVFHVLASVERLEGLELEPTSDNGPLLERGAGRSVWRENVAIAQIVPLTSATDLDAVPDADLVQCLEGAS
jgi:hypothetical protein